ncbi:hypothetical protein CVD28_21220 [Bacillus sp. M6-12]|uniref:hypothetical protein n=1 Tax=Bacillus sp. M6-12 TaxID=2054166 RepID=UPI000C765187|nr:hypothetical protein [Bacillus sp. M6-12]PLS15685.1 hypothetical protein CVD28_21220 [Bacillus sp. M6-12]
MVRKKAIACSGIFFFLFIGAWIINEGSKREYINFNHREAPVSVYDVSDPLIRPVQEGHLDKTTQWNFKPREYIQIRKLDKEM